MLDHPLFTKYLDSTQGLDPLGSGPVNETLYRSVFPGINNAVRYVRIYSAICWMVRQIELTAERTKTKDYAKLSAAGLEKIQLLLSWYASIAEIGGVAGAQRAYPTDDDQATTLRFRVLVDSGAVARLGDPTFVPGEGAHHLTAPQYRPSLVGGLCFLQASPSVPNTWKLTKAGEVLADAYDDVVGNDERREWLADPEALTTTRGQVKEMGSLLDLLKPSAREKQAFLEQYYPLLAGQAIGPNWENRWAGITLALRALEAEQHGGGADEETIRYTMARGYSLKGQQLNLNDIAEVQGWWANLQLRQYQRLALDTLFRYAQSWVGNAMITDQARDISSFAEAAGTKLNQVVKYPWSESVANYCNTLNQLKGDARTFFEASITTPELDLHHRMDALWAVSNFAPNTEQQDLALREAYLALVFCALEARNLKENPYVVQRFRNDRFPLSTLDDLVSQFHSASPADFLEHVMRFHVVLQHFTVVQERTRDQRNRFVLMQGDKGLERVASTSKGIGNASVYQDRLFHALLLLEQCSLVEQEAGRYRLTGAGAATLELGLPRQPEAA